MVTVEGAMFLRILIVPSLIKVKTKNLRAGPLGGSLDRENDRTRSEKGKEKGGYEL